MMKPAEFSFPEMYRVDQLFPDTGIKDICGEVRRLLEEKFFLEIPKCRTMVFTDKPVSMKYRGLYELARRDPGKLVYETELGLLDLSEVIPLWLKKFEKS